MFFSPEIPPFHEFSSNSFDCKPCLLAAVHVIHICGKVHKSLSDGKVGIVRKQGMELFLCGSRRNNWSLEFNVRNYSNLSTLCMKRVKPWVFGIQSGFLVEWNSNWLKRSLITMSVLSSFVWSAVLWLQIRKCLTISIITAQHALQHLFARPLSSQQIRPPPPQLAPQHPQFQILVSLQKDLLQIHRLLENNNGQIGDNRQRDTWIVHIAWHPLQHQKQATNLMCYLIGTAVCSKSKCMRASISRVSSKLACSSLAIVRRGGTVGGLKFSDLFGHWWRKVWDRNILRPGGFLFPRVDHSPNKTRHQFQQLLWNIQQFREAAGQLLNTWTGGKQYKGPRLPTTTNSKNLEEIPLWPTHP